VIASAVGASTRDGAAQQSPDRDAMLLAAYSAGEAESETKTEGDRAPAAAKVPPVKRVAVEPAAAVKQTPAPAPAPTEGAQRLRGWMIQVGAYESQASAKDGLKLAASNAARLLRDKPTSVVAFRQGNKTLYRARLGNLSRIDAMQACRQLSHKMPCMMLPPGAGAAQAEERRRG